MSSPYRFIFINQTHFHKKGCARGLILKQRHKVNWKWVILIHQKSAENRKPWRATLIGQNFPFLGNISAGVSFSVCLISLPWHKTEPYWIRPAGRAKNSFRRHIFVGWFVSRSVVKILLWLSPDRCSNDCWVSSNETQQWRPPFWLIMKSLASIKNASFVLNWKWEKNFGNGVHPNKKFGRHSWLKIALISFVPTQHLKRHVFAMIVKCPNYNSICNVVNSTKLRQEYETKQWSCASTTLFYTRIYFIRGWIRNVWVGMCRWDLGTLSLYQS